MSLLNLISKDANWKGMDDFPSTPEWELEVEKWLEFLKRNDQLERFIPRLKSKPCQRDEAFAEIQAAFYIDTCWECPIVDWEPKGSSGKNLEFAFKGNNEIIVFCEVKSPGWEGEVVEDEGTESLRKKDKKFVSGETRRIAPWKNIRKIIIKAYPKFFIDQPSLLIINDDLFVSPLENKMNIDIALFCEKGRGDHGSESYLSEDGYFLTEKYQNLGGILFLKVFQTSKKIEYKSKFAKNPRASPACQIPLSIG